MKKNNMVEKDLEKKIILNLKMLECEVAKAGETSTYNSHWCLSGMSDLIVFIPNGGIVFMEVKQESRRNTKNGGLRDTQIEFKKLCEKCGLRYVVVYNKSEALEAVR